MLVPVLLMSDQTFPTNLYGDKKLWPLFMSIANIRSEFPNKPLSQAWLLVGFLPVGPKRNNKVAGFSAKDQEYDPLSIQHKIIAHVLLPLTKLFKVRIQSYGGVNVSFNKVGMQEG